MIPTSSGTSVPGTADSATSDTRIRQVCADYIEVFPDDDPRPFECNLRFETVTVSSRAVLDETLSPDAVRLLLLLLGTTVSYDAPTVTVHSVREEHGRLIGDFDQAMIQLIRSRHVLCDESRSGVLTISEVHA